MITPIKVSEGIFRGPQVVFGDDWKALYNLGIRFSLKLNYEDEGTDKSALGRGIEVIPCPMPPRDLIGALGKPDPESVAVAVNMLADVKNRPIYVHCTHGQDRTGIVVAEYRVLHEGWTLDAAWREMLTLGFHWMLPNLMNTWTMFYIEQAGLRWLLEA